MTKYEELCELYIETDDGFNGYIKECTNFAFSIKKGFKEFLGCEMDDLFFYSPESEGEKTKKSSDPREVLELKNDSFGHFGMAINLRRQKPYLDPGVWFIFDFAIIKKNDIFTVKIGKDKEFEIDTEELDDFNPLFDFLYEETKKRYQNYLERYLNGEIEDDPSKNYIH